MKEITEIYELSKLKQEMLWVVRAFSYENDLTFCVISVSYLEACLKEFLTSKLIKSNTSDSLLSHKGALGTSFSKAQLAYCMEYIEKKQFQDIQTLLDIRNLFAHTHEQQSFNNKEIDDKCRNLNLSSMLKIEDVAEASRNGYQTMLKTPKIRFSMACTTICNHLLYNNQ